MPWTTVAPDVDAYLDNLPQDQKKLLEKVRKAIRTACPKAEELISYQIPTYKYYGNLIHFAAFKNHCSIIGISKKMISLYKDELSPFRVSGSTIHITPANPISSTLVRKMVKTRMKENEERKSIRDTVKDSKKQIRK